MSRRDLIRHLHANGCHLAREGGRHSIYYNPANGQTAAVPRHTQVDDFLVRKICRELDIPRP